MRKFEHSSWKKRAFILSINRVTSVMPRNIHRLNGLCYCLALVGRTAGTVSDSADPPSDLVFFNES
jgi:hypothetical protein